MKKVKKKKGNRVLAFCLGEQNPGLERLIKAGYIKKDRDHWLIFSRESKEGEIALTGDYVKLDTRGIPYPNSRKFFLENHTHIRGDEYEQIPKALEAWTIEDGMCEEIQFLVKEKGLLIHEDDEKAYFTAPLWGDVLFAPKDAAIVFYELKYGPDHKICDASFNFVARDEFQKTYSVIQEDEQH